MENPDPIIRKKTLRRSSKNSHISMSDTESQVSQVDSFHSPLRSDSPLHSDDPIFYPENDAKNGINCKESLSNCKALVPVDNYYSPLPSPGQSNFPSSVPANGGKGRQPETQLEKPKSENVAFRASSPATVGKVRRPFSPSMTENYEFSGNGGRGPTSVVAFNRSGREEPVTKMGPVGGGGGGEDEVGGERRSREAVASILRRSKWEVTVKKAALGFRVCEVIVCLISFSVMAADRTRGWSGDSFDRYKEYRYCVAVNVIGFGYSGFQAYDLTYHLVSGKHVISHYLRYHFDFSMDQILAYLIMSASSSAATRVDGWTSTWGKDEFTIRASASIAVSFLAFIIFALSSLVSGYNLCNREAV